MGNLAILVLALSYSLRVVYINIVIDGIGNLIIEHDAIVSEDY